MGLEYAAAHLTAAVQLVAKSERPLPERVQQAWDDHVQMLWMQPCLTAELLGEFRDFWHHYTEPSDNRTSTKMRELTKAELESVIDQLIALSSRACVVAAQSSPDVALATLRDLA